MFRQKMCCGFGGPGRTRQSHPRNGRGTEGGQRREADHELHRHEADARPFGRVHDGQRGVGGGNGRLLQEELRHGSSDGT